MNQNDLPSSTRSVRRVFCGLRKEERSGLACAWLLGLACPVFALGAETPAPAPATATATAATVGVDPTAAAAGGQFSEESMQFDFALGLLRRGLAKESAAEFSKFLTAYPHSSRRNDALLHRAEGLFTVGNFKSAAQDYYAYLKNTRSNEPGPRLRYGICLFELQDAAAALQLLQPLLAEGGAPEQVASATYYTGLCQQKLGQVAPARENFRKVSAGSFRPLALYALAETYQDAKEYERAAEYYQQVTRDFPAHALATRAQLARANALRLAGKLAESGADFQLLLASDDPAVRLRAEYGLAWTEYGNGQPARAEELAKKILATPQGAEFYAGTRYLLGSIEFARKNYAAAVEQFARVEPGDFSSKAQLARGWALYEQKDFPAALTLAQQGLREHPEFPADEFAYLAGRAALDGKQPAQAASFLQQARDAGGERKERAAYELALAQEQAKNLPASAEAFDWFLRNCAGSPLAGEASLGLGRVLMAQQRYEAAVPVYAALGERTNIAAGQREQGLARLAVCYYYLKQYENMAAVYERLLKAFPQGQTAAEALFWLGWQDAAQKRYPEAATRYEELLKRFPDHTLAPKARYYLGSSLLRAGQEEKAAEVFYALAMLPQKDKTSPGLEGRELLWLGQFFAGRGNTEKAQAVYALLLQREKPGLVQAVALRGQGEARRQEKSWTAALESYRALLQSLKEISGQPGAVATLRNDGLYGLAFCLRETGKLAEARQQLDQIVLAGDDPFLAKVYFERGLLEFAAENYSKAAESLMRVGLLVEDEELAGKALLKAAEASEKAGDLSKAQICWDELAGKLDGSYGRLYPNNAYTVAGKEHLKKAAAKPAP